MDTFFGIPTGTLALGALFAAGAALGVLALRAWRWPVFLRLGLRQLPRRPAQTALIVAGLMLSTALVTASLATGDTITHAIRAAAVTELGRLDQVVTYSAPAGSQQGAPPGAGGDPFASSTFFPGEVFARVARGIEADAALRLDVEGATPAIWLGCTVLDLTSRQTATASVRGLPPEYPPVFGALVDLEGRALSLAALQPGEVVVNEAARGALAVQPGDDLSCTLEGVPVRWRVAAVAAARGLGAGAGVSLFLPLAQLQRVLSSEPTAGAVDAVNQIWIANRGDAISGAARSERVVEAIRPLLVDAGALQDVRQLLTRADLRAALAARRGSLSERTQGRLAELLEIADRPPPPATGDSRGGALSREGRDLDRLLRIQSLRAALLAGARDTRDAELVRTLGTALQRATGYQVLAVKRQVLEIADRAGNVITTIFLLFSLLSIAAGLLLVFLIFSLLAAARRSELGIARALGTGRGHLIAMFTFEGVAYALLAAAVGVPAGLGISRVLLALLIWAVESGAFGFSGVAARVADTVTWYAAPRSAALAASLGLLLTIVTVTVAAWQVSRVTIVTAIRDLPDPPSRSHGVLAWGWTGLFPGGATLIALGLRWGQTFPFAAGVSLLLLGCGVAVSVVGDRLPARGDWRKGGAPRPRWGARAGATLAGMALAAYWALPFDAQERLGLPRLASGIEIFGLAGVLMVVGTTWALSANGDLALRLASWSLTAAGRPAPALRLAAAHLLRQPFRTGVTTTMFALVVFMLTVMQVITAAAVHFQADAVIKYGGWDLRGHVTATAGQGPETGPPERPVPVDGAPEGAPLAAPESPAAPATAQAQPPATQAAADQHLAETVVAAIADSADLQRYVAAAGVRTAAFFAVTQLSAPAPTWGGYVVAAIDEGFARGNLIPLQTRARGYATDQAVWEALAADPSLAVIDANALPSPQLRGGINLSTLSFTLQGIDDRQTAMEPVPVWIGNSNGGAARKVSIVGVIDRRVATAFRGVYVAPEVLRGLGTPLRPATSRLFFRLQPGADVNEARAALGAAFFAQGLQTESLMERFQNESGPLILASRMLQLFVGLGLFVGVAALGVISTRAAVERRQEIGILRAIGLSRRRVTVSLLLESALVVVLGSVIGITLGLVLCRNVFAVQFFDRFQQGLKMVVPWQELLLTVLLTCAAALVATWLPARQASRIPPIAAIREA